MTVLIIVLSVIAIAVLWQAIELRQFRTTEYEIQTDKVHHTVRLVVLAYGDLPRQGQDGTHQLLHQGCAA